jgi:hypothetical protein
MTIFTTQKTKQELQMEEARRQAQYRQGMLVAFASALCVAYRDFWKNPLLSPQEQCDLLGDSAMELFAKHAVGVQFVLENMPNITDFIPDFMDMTHLPDGVRVESVDGKLVITLPIEEEEEETPE